MDNKLSSIKERVIYIVKNKGDRLEDFFSEIGMTYGNFKGEAKKTPLNSTAVENILAIYPDLSPDWLISGKGEILRPPEKNTAEEKRKETPAPNPADINIIVELSTRLGEQTNENKHLHHTNMELTAQIETLKSTIEELKAQLHEQKKQGKPYYSDTAPLSAVAEPDPPAVLKKTAKKAPLAPPNQGSSTIFGAKKI